MTEEVKDNPEYQYDPRLALARAGAIQDKLLQAVDQLDPEDLLFKPQVMENVNTLLNNVNGTAVQVMRNSIVESNSNAGVLADAVIAQMEQRGLTLIQKGGSKQGHVPEAVMIDENEFEGIETGMLEKGLVHKTFDEFADEHGIKQVDNID